MQPWKGNQVTNDLYVQSICQPSVDRCVVSIGESVTLR